MEVTQDAPCLTDPREVREVTIFSSPILVLEVREVIERKLGWPYVIVESCSCWPGVIESAGIVLFRRQGEKYKTKHPQRSALNVHDNGMDAGAAQGGPNSQLLGIDGYADAHGGLCTPQGAGTAVGWNLHASAPETGGSHCCGHLNSYHAGPQVVAS